MAKSSRAPAGFGEHTKRPGIWRYQYRFGGRVREFTIGRDSRDAGALATALDASEGQPGQIPLAVNHDRFVELMRTSRGAKEPMRYRHAVRIAQCLEALVAAGRDPVEMFGARKARTERQRQATAARQEEEDAEEAGDRERQRRRLSTVVGQYIAWMRTAGKRTAEDVRKELARHVLPSLGDRDVAEIGRADAIEVYTTLASNGHKATGHRVYRLLRAVLSYAVDQELIEANRLAGIKRDRIPRPGDRKRTLIRFFEDDEEPDPGELLMIWEAADKLPEPRRTFVKLLVLTGQRQGAKREHGEVGRMKWADLDLQRAIWTIPEEDHKGKRGHVVPLPKQAVALIEALPRISEYVFANQQKAMLRDGAEGRNHRHYGRPIGDTSAIKDQIDAAVLEDTGKVVEDWCLHDLRRTCGSWIEEQYGEERMKAVLGHALGSKLSRVYARGTGFQKKRQALQAWADYVTGETGKVVAYPTAA